MTASPDVLRAARATDVVDEPPVPARSLEAPAPIDVAISVGLWTVGLSWLVPSLGAMTLAYKVIPAHRIDVLGRIYSRVQVALTGSRWRAVVHPAVDPERPYIFIQNHINIIDHAVAYCATPHYKQGLELETHFRYPFYGWFMKARGTVPVHKNKSGQTSDLVERIGEELREGRSILAFPEGSRTRTGRVMAFRTGIFRVAQELGAPIVPVAVTGSFETQRPGSWMLWPGSTITVYCEAPIETQGLREDDVPELAERVRAIIAARVDAYWDERARAR